MMGKGVGPRIPHEYPKALPFWCSSHLLNLCILAACDIGEVCKMMGVADKMTVDFMSTKTSTSVPTETSTSMPSETSTLVLLKPALPCLLKPALPCLLKPALLYLLKLAHQQRTRY